MFRRGKPTPRPTGDPERQALFEKLAQRPESVCPFLGLAEARAEFGADATDDHRCYAFGDPEPVSGEQQRNVCLQLGYANCPRYLRGVLVIPSDELEALRRPPQRVPPPPPQSTIESAARDRGGRRRLVLVFMLVLVVAGGIGAWWALAGPGAVAEVPTPSPDASRTPAPSATPEPSVVPSTTPGPVDAISGTEGFTTTGSAMLADGVLRLTPSDFQLAGGAWFPHPVNVADGFTAAFSLRITQPQGDGGDGLAFVVQTDGPVAVGGIGGEIGYGGLASVAVELDTHFNAWPSADDPNDNHVSVQTAGAAPNSADHGSSRAATTQIPDLSDGQIHAVLVVYSPGRMSIAVDGAEVLELDIDIAADLALADGRATYIGFTASTGDTAQEISLLAVEITFP